MVSNYYAFRITPRALDRKAACPIGPESGGLRLSTYGATMMRDEFQPDWASPPGETISEVLSERGISIEDFAAKMGFTVKAATDLLTGKATISLGIARKLEDVIGGSFQFWISRDCQYRDDASRLASKYKDWLRELPVGDMVKFGWIEPTEPLQEAATCLRFFDVANVSAWHKKYAKIEHLVAFRTSRSFESRPASVAAWLRQGELLADKIQCKPWNPSAFESALLRVRRLTRQSDPNRFLQELGRICSECGVAFVVVRGPNGCRASGASRFLSENKVLLQLSFRYLSDDQFWFTFFHEARHALRLAGRGLVIDGIGEQSTSEEREADEFAARILIPDNYRDEFNALRADAKQVIKFSQKIGVAPGIVVGQLQHAGKIPRNWLNGLKRRYVWDT